jgi:Tfp pilus assembly PilM family ATPase
VVNVPGSATLVRKIQVETTEMNYLHDWVMWEAQQYLPAPLEEYVVDYQKLRLHEESGLWEILVVLARREAIRERTRLFKAVNLKPAIMDVDPMALQNSFEVNYPSVVDFPVAVVNLEGDLTTILATRGGVPEGVSTMVTPAESEELCRKINTTLADLLDRMIPEGGDRKETRFGKVLFSGGGPHLPDVVNFLSSAGQLEVELADPFRELAILPALREKLDQSYRASEFMLATGLALRKA